MTLPDEARRQAEALIAERLGLRLPETRRPDLDRGIVEALRDAPVATPGELPAWLATLPDESPAWRRLAGRLTIGETYFFRDGPFFEALEQEVLPGLIATRRGAGTLRLRVWSAGCATGEEPYSLAIALDRLLGDPARWALTILATDLNPEALDVAVRGLYRDRALRDTPPWLCDRYFRRHGDGQTLELARRIREMVTFAPLNLAAESYPALITNTGAMDLVVCRNVLMYLAPDVQRGVAARLGRALVPGGWLSVSPAEATAELFHPLVPVNFTGAIFFRSPLDRETPRVLSRLPDPPPLPSTPAAAGPVRVAAVPARAVPVVATSLETPSPLGQARTLADQGKLDEARRVAETAAGRDRLNPDAHLLLAAICQEQGHLESALEALRRVIYLAPDSAGAHFMMGSLLLRRGGRDRARRSMETVVRLLEPVPRGQPIPGSEGLTAGRLLETARAYLESL
jgi:chemotaxis protein methyltransferase CheR